jgi:hypothetical protein
VRIGHRTKSKSVLSKLVVGADLRRHDVTEGRCQTPQLPIPQQTSLPTYPRRLRQHQLVVSFNSHRAHHVRIRCMQESFPEATKAAEDGAKAFEIADDVAAIEQVASCTPKRGEKLERRRG